MRALLCTLLRKGSAQAPTMRRSERLQVLAKELEVAMALKGGSVEECTGNPVIKYSM